MQDALSSPVTTQDTPPSTPSLLQKQLQTLHNQAHNFFKFLSNGRQWLTDCTPSKPAAQPTGRKDEGPGLSWKLHTWLQAGC